jgi:hypothetical protein
MLPENPFPCATAVLVPPKERRQNRARYHTAKAGRTLRSSMWRLAGVYSGFSWQNMPGGAYFNKRFVSRNEDAGRLVSVVEQSAAGADIRLIPSIGK